ncbi:MAG: hypothetical protein KIT69_13735, partial [Propionibacteriaceae bacterium]|nr:hypothetical protein [Propionibacteriaceae bacterium]
MAAATVTTTVRTTAPKQRIRPLKVVLSVVAIVLALAWVFPVYWMVTSALLPNAVLQSVTPRFLPFGGSL